MPQSLSEFKEYADYVDTLLAKAFRSRKGLYGIAARTLFPGKRLRSIMALLWCEAISGNYRPAGPIALAYEFAHTAALVQDDLIDNSVRRRGSPTIHTRYGLATGVLASNLLLFEIPHLIANYLDEGFTRPQIRKILTIIGDACRLTTLGEYLDLQLAGKDEVTVRQYLEMARMKTGALLAAPCACGAIVGGGSEENVASAFAFGEKIGVAYQIRDDVSDVFATENGDNEPLFNDLRNSKKNFIVIHALRHASTAGRSFIRGVLGKEKLTQSDMKQIQEIGLKTRSVEEAKDLATQIAGQAKSCLDSLKPSTASKKLLKLVDYVQTIS